MQKPHICQYAKTAYSNLVPGCYDVYPRIRNLREDSDLRQIEIANMLNTSQATYSRYENGVLDIPSVSLIMLAEYYQTSIDYLVGLTNVKEPYKRNR
jgi:transcriptional regulator with XRE-family HTH domain